MWPLTALAQQSPPTVLRVGYSSVQPRTSPVYGAFITRMMELGYEEGRNFIFEFVQASSPDSDGYGAAYRKLAVRNVDIVMTTSAESVNPAIAISGGRPIVMIAVDFDPFARGYVASLARPGGNITGLFIEQPQLAAKRLQLLKDSFPTLRGATVFWDQVSADQWHVLERAAAGMPDIHISGVELKERPYDYERALTQVAPEDRGALIVLASPVFALDRGRLPDFALQHRMISLFYVRRFVDLGGLLSYGASITETFRRAAEYVDRIARGAKPGDLPIETPTKYELVVNLKTANALGITIPPSILVRADEVIE